MDKQEIFDKVANALIKQGKPSLSEDGYCSYFNSDGSRCAIGWLVDKRMAKDFQKMCPNKSVYTVDEKFVLEGIIGVVDLQFLASLQDAHDEDSPKSDWLDSFKNKMRGIATTYKLDPSALDQ